MSRLPNLTHVNRKSEQKALWNRRGRKHICVELEKKKKRTEKQRTKQISKPLAVGSAAHGDRK